MPILIASWIVSLTKLELYVGVAIFIIALIGIAYMFVSGQWTWDDFNSK